MTSEAVPASISVNASLPQPTNRRGIAWILCELSATLALIVASFESYERIGGAWGWLPVWLLCQALLGLLLFQWFVLMHGCGHGALVANRRLNDVFGHLASVFCLVPYFSWRYIHAQHHRWVGWVDKDPTTGAIAGPLPSPPVQWLMNVCWRLWIPIFSVAFGLSVFWNPKRVALVAPALRQRRRTIFSMLFLGVVYVVALAIARLRFFEVWAAAYLCYLFIGDPVLLSQHVHLPLLRSRGASVKPFHTADQDRFTRTIVLPRWAAKWLLLEFTTHGVHHAHPQVAHYDIDRVPFSSTHAISWYAWLHAAKRMPVVRLLYETSQQTGIDI